MANDTPIPRERKSAEAPPHERLWLSEPNQHAWQSLYLDGTVVSNCNPDEAAELAELLRRSEVYDQITEIVVAAIVKMGDPEVTPLAEVPYVGARALTRIDFLLHPEAD